MKLQTKILLGYAVTSLVFILVGSILITTTNSLSPVVDELDEQIKEFSDTLSTEEIITEVRSLRTELHDLIGDSKKLAVVSIAALAMNCGYVNPTGLPSDDPNEGRQLVVYEGDIQNAPEEHLSFQIGSEYNSEPAGAIITPLDDLDGTSPPFDVSVRGDLLGTGLSKWYIDFADNDSSKNPSAGAFITDITIDFRRAVPENEAVDADNNELQDMGIDGLDVTITGLIGDANNDVSGNPINKLSKWLGAGGTTEGNTTTGFTKGRYGLRLDNAPQWDVVPTSTLGYHIKDCNFKYIGDRKDIAEFTIRLSLGGDIATAI